MKTIALFCASLLFSVSIFAQQPTNQDPKTYDTLKGPVFYTGNLCAQTKTYSNIGTGYLTGNGYITQGTTHCPLTEISQTIDNSTALAITGVVAKIKKIYGSSGNIKAKIYTVDTTFKPISLLGTSNTINTSSLTAGDNTVTLTFTSPVNVTANFAASLVLPTGGDTIVVYSTPENCINPSKSKYAYVYITYIGWYAYKTYEALFAKGSFDLFIYALKGTPDEIKENPLNAYVNLYPNPADQEITIASAGNIEKIEVMNCLGQRVYEAQPNTAVCELNTSVWNTGIYILQIETEKGTICKKITVDR
jgi:hypothetical protein